MYIDKFDLTGKVAVVTGGARNIGLACADALSEAGAKVVVMDRDNEVGHEAVETICAKGRTAEFKQLDVTDPEQTEAVAEDVFKRHGRVDILVANAGICINHPAEEATDDDWMRVMDINVNGVFWSNRAFGRKMLKNGSGSIINIGSMSGIVSNKPQPQAAYNASKAAVHMLTKSLAGEWSDRGIRVNAVAPTYIATDMTIRGATNESWFKVWMEMTPMKRMGNVSEVASLVLFLASDAASLVTGSVVSVDGGYTVW